MVLLFLLPLSASDSASEEEQALLLGKGYLESGDYKNALKSFQRVLEIAPEKKERWELIGYCYLKMKKYREAIGAYEKSKSGGPSYHLYLAQCYRALKEYGVARRHYATLLEKHGGKREKWTDYARTQLRELQAPQGYYVILSVRGIDDILRFEVNGKPAGEAEYGAREEMILNAHLKPGENRLRLVGINTSGTWCFGADLRAQKKRVWSINRGNFDKGEGAFEGDLTVGIVLDHSLVLDYSKDGLKVLKESSAVDLEGAYKAIKEGNRLWTGHDYKKGLDLYEKAARKWPGLDWIHKRLADLYESMADAIVENPGEESREKRAWLEKARKAKLEWARHRESAVRLAPKNNGSYYSLAEAQLKIGALDKAEKSYRECLKLNPQHRGALVGLGKALVGQNKISEGLKIYDYILRLHPAWSWAHIYRGDALVQAGRMEEALDEYGKAKALDAKLEQFVAERIFELVEKEGPNSYYLKKSERSFQLNPKNLKNEVNLGHECVKALQYERAIRHYDEALRKGSADPEIFPRLGLAYELTGKPEEADKAYKKAVRIGSYKDLCRHRLERLKFFRHKKAGKKVKRENKERIPFIKAQGRKGECERELAALKKKIPLLVEGLIQLPQLCDGVVSSDDIQALKGLNRLFDIEDMKPLKPGIDRLCKKTAPHARIVIDGVGSEWEDRDLLVRDEKGDTKKNLKGADLEKACARILDGDLYLMWKCYGKTDVSEGITYWVTLYISKEEPWHELGISKDGIALIRHMPDGKTIKVYPKDVEYKVGEVLEAKLPLYWLHNRTLLHLQFFSWLKDPGVLDSAEARQTVALRSYFPPELMALFDIAAGSEMEKGDRIALALALVSGEMWLRADGPWKKLLRADAARMLRFGRKISKWQKTSGCPPLSEMPLSVLCFWAYRNLRGPRVDNQYDYRRYFVDIDVLERMFEHARARHLFAPRVSELVQRIENYFGLKSRLQYTSWDIVSQLQAAQAGKKDMIGKEKKKKFKKYIRDVYIDGTKTHTDDTFTVNLQFDYFLLTHVLLGTCHQQGEMVTNFCRALGIPASYAKGEEIGAKFFGNPHLFSTYYDVKDNRWKAYQGKYYKGLRALRLRFYLPPFGSDVSPQCRSYSMDTTYDLTGKLFLSGLSHKTIMGALQRGSE
jgi:tetratricopeptide (TPR) repeat protein